MTRLRKITNQTETITKWFSLSMYLTICCGLGLDYFIPNFFSIICQPFGLDANETTKVFCLSVMAIFFLLYCLWTILDLITHNDQ